MIVKNFNKGNYRFCGTGSSVYYGLIQMTPKEFDEAMKYLARCKFDHKFLLKEDIANKEHFNGGFQLSVRVSATRKLFEKYNLPRYKQQNYIIQVLTKQ